MIFKKEFVKTNLDNQKWEFNLGKRLAQYLNLKSCVDFSCGIGSCMNGLIDGGCKDVTGYEYWDLASNNLYTEIPNDICRHIIPGDFKKTIKTQKQYDCSICTKLVKQKTKLIENLCNASSKYIFILCSKDLMEQTKKQFQKRGFNPFSDTLIKNMYLPVEIKDNVLVLVRDISDKKLIVSNTMFGTSPKIFHHHGRPSLNTIGYNLKRDFLNIVAYNASELYRDIKYVKFYSPKIINRRESKSKEFNKKVTVAHVSNYANTGSGVNCMEWLEYNHTVLGKDIVNFQHINKLECLCEFVKNHVETEYTLYIDDPDIFVIDRLDDIIAKFESFNCDFLFQSDGWMYPKGFPKDLYEYFIKIAPMETPHKFLNSGAFIFKTDYYKNIIPKLLEKKSYNRNICQSVYINLFRHEYPKMKLDYYSEIFQSTAYNQWFEDRYGKFDLKIDISKRT